MLNEMTISILHRLKLFGMTRGLEERLHNPQHAELSHEEFVGLLVEDEKIHRDNKRLKRLLKNAKLKYPSAAMEDINYRQERGLNKQVMLQLANTQWIGQHRNVIFTGATGLGKSWLACALGNLAARAGLSVAYHRTPRLLEMLHQARGDGTHLRALAHLAKTQLLILDDVLLTPLSEEERVDFLEIVEDRYAAGATVLTSQYGGKDWHERIGDPTIADAICDRLFHNAYKIDLQGKESIRKLEGIEQECVAR
jgi:DNA replication protein DnaC